MAAASAVAVPGGGPAAAALVQALSLKCRDKDGQVALAALELLLQIPLQMLAATLDAEAWRECVLAGLTAAAGGGGAGTAVAAGKRAAGSGSAAALSCEGRAALFGVLQAVLSGPTTVAPHALRGVPGGGRGAVGLDGCRREVLQLLHNPAHGAVLGDLVARLAAECAAPARLGAGGGRGARVEGGNRGSGDEWDSELEAECAGEDSSSDWGCGGGGGLPELAGSDGGDAEDGGSEAGGAEGGAASAIAGGALVAGAAGMDLDGVELMLEDEESF